MTTPARTTRPHPSQARREQLQQAPDYERNLSVIKAAVVAPPGVLVERLEVVERQLADQARIIEVQGARIAALEARPAENEDGRPRKPGTWFKAKEAAHKLGYSPSGLRNLAKKGRIVFDVEGNGRRIYNIASVVAPSAPSVP
jgi:hypothetical protein